MPTANAEELHRSERTDRCLSSRPFRCRPWGPSQPSALDVGVRRKVAKTRSALGPSLPSSNASFLRSASSRTCRRPSGVAQGSRGSVPSRCASTAACVAFEGLCSYGPYSYGPYIHIVMAHMVIAACLVSEGTPFLTGLRVLPCKAVCPVLQGCWLHLVWVRVRSEMAACPVLQGCVSGLKLPHATPHNAVRSAL